MTRYVSRMILRLCKIFATWLDFARNFEPSSMTMHGPNRFVTTPRSVSDGSLLTYGKRLTKNPIKTNNPMKIIVYVLAYELIRARANNLGTVNPSIIGTKISHVCRHESSLISFCLVSFRRSVWTAPDAKETILMTKPNI